MGSGNSTPITTREPLVNALQVDNVEGGADGVVLSPIEKRARKENEVHVLGVSRRSCDGANKVRGVSLTLLSSPCRSPRWKRSCGLLK